KKPDADVQKEKKKDTVKKKDIVKKKDNVSRKKSSITADDNILPDPVEALKLGESMILTEAELQDEERQLHETHACLVTKKVSDNTESKESEDDEVAPLIRRQIGVIIGRRIPKEYDKEALDHTKKLKGVAFELIVNQNTTNNVELEKDYKLQASAQSTTCAAIEEYQLFTQELKASSGWVVNKDKSIEYLQELVQRDEEMVQRLQALEREVEERAEEKLLFIKKLKGNGQGSMINNVSVKLRAAIEEYQLFTQELEASPDWVVNKDMSIEYLQELVQRDKEMPSKHFGCEFYLWKETRLRELMSSPGAPSTPSYSAGHSTPPSYSSGPSTPPSYSSGPSTPTNYSLGSSRNGECSNCKHLRGKISVLKATMDMHMHPEQHTVNSAALFHEVLNEMEKLDLE
ncbi:hypothetical protein Tco_0256850, partial [Tanacetum coccineum]